MNWICFIISIIVFLVKNQRFDAYELDANRTVVAGIVRFVSFDFEPLLKIIYVQI